MIHSIHLHGLFTAHILHGCTHLHCNVLSLSTGYYIRQFYICYMMPVSTKIKKGNPLKKFNNPINTNQAIFLVLIKVIWTFSNNFLHQTVITAGLKESL